MGGIVDDFQTILVGYFLDAFRITRFAIDMHGHNGRGLRSNGSFDLVRIDVAGFGINIHKHRLDTVPPQGMGSSYKTVGGGDDFTRDAQGLQGAHQRKGTVGEQADVGYFQVLTQGLL